MQEITLQPGESITVTAATSEPSTIFKINNDNQWTSLTRQGAMFNGQLVDFGTIRNSRFEPIPFFRFIDQNSGKYYQVAAPIDFNFPPTAPIAFIIQGDRIIAWTPIVGTTRVQAWELRMVGNPVTQILTESQQEFGDDMSHIGQNILELDNGGIVAFYWQRYSTPEHNLQCSFAYRHPQTKQWSTLTTEVQDGHLGGSLVNIYSIAFAQHPASGEIWAFTKRDSFSNMIAFRLSVSNDILSLKESIPEFIVYGDKTQWTKSYCLEGENPRIHAVAAPDRNSIILAYQCDHFEMFKYPVPFIKGAWFCLTEVAVNGSYQQTEQSAGQWNLEHYHERVADFGLAYKNNKVYIAHHSLTGDEERITFVPLPMYLSTYDFAEERWEEPIPLGNLLGWPVSNEQQPIPEFHAGFSIPTEGNTTTIALFNEPTSKISNSG